MVMTFMRTKKLILLFFFTMFRFRPYNFCLKRFLFLLRYSMSYFIYKIYIILLAD